MRKKMTKCGINCKCKNNYSLEDFEEDFAEKLDRDLYLPVKKELKNSGVTHSLGMRKEKLKQWVHEKLKVLNNE